MGQIGIHRGLRNFPSDDDCLGRDGRETPSGVGKLVGEDPDAKKGPDRSQPTGIRARSAVAGGLSRFSTTRWKTRHLAGAYAVSLDGLVCPTGGVMKNNVKIALTLAVALALFFVVKHFFPLSGAGR